MAVAQTGKPLGVGRLHFNTIAEAQIRYMAVASGYQRKGIGGLILDFLENRARSLGAARIVLEAREAASGFYRKKGYTASGPGRTLFNCIAHVRMSKQAD
jgi:GNAT superfamily N-acetyltransferase